MASHWQGASHLNKGDVSLFFSHLCKKGKVHRFYISFGVLSINLFPFNLCIHWAGYQNPVHFVLLILIWNAQDFAPKAQAYSA